MITLDTIDKIELDADTAIVEAMVAKSTNITKKNDMYGIWLGAFNVTIQQGMPWESLDNDQQQALNLIGKACKKMGL